MVSTLVIGIVLSAVGLWLALIAMMTRAMRKNREADAFVSWRRSLGPLFAIGFGP
jgi:hypothetical protein